jgi:N-acetylneuraminate synthase/N,N'-diacetyllegionaminate synthase
VTAVTIAGHRVGPGEPAYLVAEAGVNHNGELAIAERMIEAAKAAGADAIKFQSFRAAEMCDLGLTERKDVEGVTGGTKSSYDMYKALELPPEAHERLFTKARETGITLFSSVFDLGMVEVLARLGTPAFKISSSDVTHLPLIRCAAAAGRPVIISTGLSTMAEVADAVACCREAGNENVILLQCTSAYPPEDDEINLNAMASLREAFGVPVGFSDHTLGIEVPIAAVAMGACMIEKHFTLDTAMPGPDQKLSLDPEGFARMVAAVRRIERAKGSGSKAPTAGELASLTDSRRSLFAARDIAPGEVITEAMVRILKPGTGIEPKFLDRVVGRPARRLIRRMTPLVWDDFEDAGRQQRVLSRS